MYGKVCFIELVNIGHHEKFNGVLKWKKYISAWDLEISTFKILQNEPCEKVLLGMGAFEISDRTKPS